MMKVFLSGIESSQDIIKEYIDNEKEIDYALFSFFYLKNKKWLIDNMCKFAKEILIDSGAHSFQKGKKVDWEEYTHEYGRWIQENDNEQILGYFEMDVDNVIGYDEVLKLRKILESYSDKIIPVWHISRGIDDFKKMCEEYQGKMISITGFKSAEIQDNQYIQFLKYANKYNCKMHCLGCTRINVLDKVPFYSVDSSTWKQAGNFGEYRKFENRKMKIIKMKGQPTKIIDRLNFDSFVNLSKFYKFYWR